MGDGGIDCVCDSEKGCELYYQRAAAVDAVSLTRCEVGEKKVEIGVNESPACLADRMP